MQEGSGTEYGGRGPKKQGGLKKKGAHVWNQRPRGEEGFLDIRNEGALASDKTRKAPHHVVLTAELGEKGEVTDCFLQKPKGKGGA